MSWLGWRAKDTIADVGYYLWILETLTPYCANQPCKDVHKEPRNREAGPLVNSIPGSCFALWFLMLFVRNSKQNVCIHIQN